MTTVVYYFLGIGISRLRSKLLYNKSKALTVLGVLLGVGVLIYFKYMNFFITSFSEMFESIGLQTNFQTFTIILPLGISFFTFRLIGYVIDIHRGSIEPTRNVVTFAAYVAFFPCLLSGPIDRPGKFIPQLKKNRPFDYNLVVDGLRQILWGLFKKMLGFEVSKNFRYPYFARNIAEFWRKWHLSLTTWFTDYIYIPLGGNRCSKKRQFFNTMVVFTICGLWHGANWTFVLWGFYNGLLFLPLVAAKSKKNYSITVSDGKMIPYLSDMIRMTCVFLLATFGWIMFRAESLTFGFEYISRIFSKSLFSFPTEVRTSLVYICLLLLIEWTFRDKEYPLQIISQIRSPFVRWAIYYVMIVVIAIFAGQKSSFIYSQF